MTLSTPPDGTRVLDARLEALVHECPDCQVPMHGTGLMTWNTLSRRWLVEYECPAHRGRVLRWGQDVEHLVRDAAVHAGFPG
ncbi:MAG: hypothetical protein U0230_23225 [Polyangiales bacterium]